MIPTATSRIEGSAILQHHDGQNPSCARTRTTAKVKTRYEFDYPLEDTHLAGEAQTVCQAPFARMRQLLGLPSVPSEKVPEDIDPATDEAPGRYHRERGSAGDGALTAGAERKHVPSGTRNPHAPSEACRTTADRRRAEHTS